MATPKFKLKTILFIVNLSIFILPIAGIYILRIYENSLVQQTESELISQGVLVSTTLEHRIKSTPNLLDEIIFTKPDITKINLKKDKWQPFLPQLRLNKSNILPKPKDPVDNDKEVLPSLKKIGVEISSILNDAQKNILSGIRVVDYNGSIIATSRGQLYQSIAGRKEVTEALKGKRVSLMRQRVSDSPSPALDSISRGTKIRVFVSIPIIVDNLVVGAVVLSRTPKSITKSIYSNYKIFIYGAIISITLIMFLTLLTSKTITKPIYELIKQAEKAKKGEKWISPTTEYPITYETHKLSQTLTEMAINIEKRTEYINSFASYVSHEFKTPLTAIKGAVEILTDHIETIPDCERDRFLSNINKDTQHLENLVNRLLEFAKADMTQVRNEKCDITEAINESIEQIKNLYLNTQIDFIVDSAKKGLQIKLPKDILHMILKNIIENSIKHAPIEGNQLQITIKTHLETPEANTPKSETTENITLMISDNGKGISENNRDMIFTPFFTTSRNSGGTGLGLPIVKSLIEAYGGSIELNADNETDNGGACFKISIPC